MQAAEIEPERPVVFYCRSGARSAMATGAFRAAGFEAYNLDGGLLAWVERGLPIEPEDGSVAQPLGVSELSLVGAAAGRAGGPAARRELQRLRDVHPTRPCRR